jgi:predicted RNase H-like HicB family nuclease
MAGCPVHGIHLAHGCGYPTCHTRSTNFAIEFDREDDGRWIAEIPAFLGVMAYGVSKADAESKVEAMALRVVADTMERFAIN